MDFFIRLAKWDIFKQPPKGQKSKWFLKQFWNFFSPKHSDFYCKLSGESILFGPMVLKNLLYSEFGLFHGYLPQFFTFLSKTVIFLLIFKNMFLKKIFYPKQSDFGCKLNEESISFGPMALQKSVLSEFGLFIKMSKRDIFEKYCFFKVL